MRRRLCTVLAIAAAAAAPASALAAGRGSGTFDRSFSRDGRATLSFERPSAVRDLAVARGKILAAGWIRRDLSGETGEDEFPIALARFNRDGTLNRRFGDGGRVRIRSGNLRANSVAVQENGRIVIAASLYGRNFVVMRLLRSGKIDRSFGRRGKVRTDLGGDDDATEVVIQRDGGIVVAGSSDDRFAVARYLRDGTLDSSFGEGGVAITAFAAGRANAADVALQSGGRIVVGGTIARPVDPGSPDDRDFAVARYLPNGNLDLGFSEDGRQTADFGGDFDGGGALAVGGQRIAIAGQHASFDSNDGDFAVAVLRGDGSLDGDFSGDGLHTLSFSDPAIDTAGAAAFQRDGKLVLVGTTQPRREPPALAMARLDPDGSLDRSFSGNGLKALAFESGNRAGAFGSALAVDRRGRLIAAGGSGGRPESSGFREPRFAVARVLP